jgi:DUF1365 family protein
MSSENFPAIGFGQVFHSRLRPARNRFRYPAYFLRLPLRSLAARPLALRWLKFNRPGLFAVNDADHGDCRPLLEWIDGLLRREGLEDATGEIWLHTFPRVAGYTFNPVSFWFAHRTDGTLRAVVCEVNNTFGERHSYLLAHADGRPLAWGEEITARKALHVSPFCAVEVVTVSADAHRRDGAQAARFVARIDYDDGAGRCCRHRVGSSRR